MAATPQAGGMDDASCVSKALLLWIEGTLWTGFKRPLTEGDRPPLPVSLDPEALHTRFQELWHKELQAAGAQHKSISRKPSVLRVLRVMVGPRMVCAVTLTTAAVAIKFGAILLLRRLVMLVAMGGSTQEGIIVAVGLGLANALESLFNSWSTFQLALSIKILLTTLALGVLQKGFMLHADVRGNFRTGDLVTLALSDCNRLVEMTNILMLGVSAPLMLVFSLTLLGVLVGSIVLATLISVALTVYIIHRIGKVQGSSFRRKATWMGRRLATVNELLQSIRFTKFYALEEHYEAQVQKCRNEEISALWVMKTSLASVWPLAGTVPITTATIVFSMLIVFEGNLPPAPDTLAMVAAARFMYIPFAFFGGAYGTMNMLLAMIKRWEKLLAQPEMDLVPFHAADPLDNEDVALSIPGCDFRWSLDPERPPTLKAIDIKVPRGELWAVVGPLGSGKSSLLAAAIGTIACDASHKGGGGVRASAPSRAYVAQEPMIVNDTLKENVLFGIDTKDPDLERRYGEALAAAALAHDLEILPAGDQTEIGEKGLTLSGGQKARVALARAVLGSQPGGLVLLDDPLSAVDAHVGSHLFNECIVGALGDTTRLLVTNQLQFLNHPNVSNVLVMEEGRIVEQGKFAELVAQEDGRLARMAASVGGGKGCTANENGSAEAGHEPSKKAEGAVVPAQQQQQPETKENKDTPAGKLTIAETKQDGAVSVAAFRFYIQAMGGPVVFVPLCIACWCFHLSEMTPDLFITVWQDDLLDESQDWYLCLWITLGFSCCLLNILSRLAWVWGAQVAARSVHNQLLRKVLHCTTSFFDRTPSGRILNKLGEDLMMSDWTAPLQLEVCIINVWGVMDVITLAVLVRPFVGPFVAFFACCFWLLRELHRRTNREAMRLFLISKSPLFGAFEETLSGITTIVAFGRERHFTHRFEHALEVNLSWLLVKEMTNLWIEQRLCLMSSLLVTALGIQMVLLPGGMHPALSGVAVIYSLQLGFYLKTMVLFLVQCEGTFASIERILQFIRTAELEPPRRLPSDEALERQSWPGSDVGLVFEDVCLRYLPRLPLALDHFSARLHPREKVGIVGRTGSGKSTIMGALFRLFPLESGRIFLGGVDIGTCGLALLRRKVTIVPQDPILFSGQLRKNLDPLGQKPDSDLWEALQRCSLDALVASTEGGLDLPVSDGGRNFSLGERQVLCLARALLRGACVLCLDEATANVDPENDQRIQRILTVEVRGCLVLTIAHRLHTVLRSDRIMVLERGHLAQLDTPEVLLETEGPFQQLCAQAGIGMDDLVAARGAGELWAQAKGFEEGWDWQAVKAKGAKDQQHGILRDWAKHLFRCWFPFDCEAAWKGV